jgi:hypothetical protein
MTKGNWREVRARKRGLWLAQQINELHSSWPCYDLINGLLCVRRGNRPHGLPVLAFQNAPRFADAAEAEEWLKANDLRGNVR